MLRRQRIEASIGKTVAHTLEYKLEAVKVVHEAQARAVAANVLGTLKLTLDRKDWRRNSTGKRMKWKWHNWRAELAHIEKMERDIQFKHAAQ